MKKTITIAQTTQVVELGKVTLLTLGDGHRSMESNWRSRGGVAGNKNTVELGSAAKLTLGGMGSRVERDRPNAQYSRPK